MASVLIAVLFAQPGTAWSRGAPESFADLVEKLMPSVVNISTSQAIEGRKGSEAPQLPPGSPFEEFFKDYFDRNPRQRPRRATSLGSGFIADAEGHVVTNYHVIKDADEITVILHDDTRLKAKVVGRDKRTDLAVLKIEPKGALTPITFGDSDATRVGDWIVAIGNPFGLGGTVTAGIVSGLGRDINVGPYDNFIQTDASINRGNSGGPMFNIEGQVIGINTMIFSQTGGSVGIGFAIASSLAEPVINQLIGKGQVRRGWLGVHIQQVTDEIAETLSLDSTKGALVASVMKDGPAERAEIKAGDVIIRFDGKEVSEMRKLPRIVASTRVDKPVEVVVWRDSKEVVLSVTVGELDDAKIQVARRSEIGAETEITELGITLSAVTDDLRKRFELDDKTKGVIVTGVKDESPAAEKGVSAGDVIVEVSQEGVSDPAEVATMIQKARDAGRRSVLFLIEGKGGLRFSALRIDKG